MILVLLHKDHKTVFTKRTMHVITKTPLIIAALRRHKAKCLVSIGTVIVHLLNVQSEITFQSKSGGKIYIFCIKLLKDLSVWQSRSQ